MAFVHLEGRPRRPLCGNAGLKRCKKSGPSAHVPSSRRRRCLGPRNLKRSLKERGDRRRPRRDSTNAIRPGGQATHALRGCTSTAASPNAGETGETGPVARAGSDARHAGALRCRSRLGYIHRMDQEALFVIARVAAAVAIGAAIGFERTFHGRPAGFRTHALVCVASALLMLVTVFQTEWMTAVPLDAIRTDPTRMAQGIVTGIGFLGAGVIFKEGLSVRGLTTAASIWVTSALGILMGTGLYFAASAATLFTLGVLSTFRWIEMRVPKTVYAVHVVRFARDEIMPEDRLRSNLREHGFKV